MSNIYRNERIGIKIVNKKKNFLRKNLNSARL